MHRISKEAMCVPCSRVGLVALVLMVLPSFAVSGTQAGSASPAELSVIGKNTATAQAVGVAPASSDTNTTGTLSVSAWEKKALGGVDRDVFELALGATRCAIKSGDVTDPATLTVIDYSRPSTADRLWVYDLRARKLIYKELVAHGQGSGENFATLFSNAPDTHRTSIGLFVTEDTYVGRNGYSLRLNGLDDGFNDRARERAIVMHGAPYVNTSLIRTRGRLGRSWGCPALRESIAREVIDTVKGGSLVFSYFPDTNWLKSSKYLSGCDGAVLATEN
jgi:L,D-transpeptidase catalytic domain